MKRFVKVTLLFLFAAIQLSGCSIAPYPTADISKNPSLVHFDPNNPPFDGEIKQTQQRDKNTVKLKRTIKVNTKIELQGDKIFSVKYHRSFLHSAANVNILVEFPNGQKYPAFFDTGFDGFALLTGDIVLDNKLAILPSNSTGSLQENSKVQGLCHIPVLHIGSATLKDVVGYYVNQQWQLHVLNIPVYKQSDMLLGLAFINKFDYVLFDNVKKEVVFSSDEVFEPDSSHLWMSFPFEIKPDSFSNERIMVQIPIAGQKLSVMFDSCGDMPGLDLNNKDWQSIAPNVTVKRLGKTYSYSWQKGRISCESAIVSQLPIGEKILTNAEVHIFDSEDTSVMSLGYFQDTVVVLDFVNSLMWIKK